MNFWLSFNYPALEISNIKDLKNNNVLIENNKSVFEVKDNVTLYALVAINNNNNNNNNNNIDNAWNVIKENFPKYKSRFIRPIKDFEKINSFIEDFVIDNKGRISYFKGSSALSDLSLSTSAQQKNKL